MTLIAVHDQNRRQPERWRPGGRGDRRWERGRVGGHQALSGGRAKEVVKQVFAAEATGLLYGVSRTRFALEVGFSGLFPSGVQRAWIGFD